MNRLVRMLREKNVHIMIKVDRFLSSEGISGLGDQPFVRHCNQEMHIHHTHIIPHNTVTHKIYTYTHTYIIYMSCALMPTKI